MSDRTFTYDADSLKEFSFDPDRAILLHNMAPSPMVAYDAYNRNIIPVTGEVNVPYTYARTPVAMNSGVYFISNLKNIYFVSNVDGIPTTPILVYEGEAGSSLACLGYVPLDDGAGGYTPTLVAIDKSNTCVYIFTYAFDTKLLTLQGTVTDASLASVNYNAVISPSHWDTGLILIVNDYYDHILLKVASDFTGSKVQTIDHGDYPAISFDTYGKNVICWSDNDAELLNVAYSATGIDFSTINSQFQPSVGMYPDAMICLNGFGVAVDQGSGHIVKFRYTTSGGTSMTEKALLQSLGSGHWYPQFAIMDVVYTKNNGDVLIIETGSSSNTTLEVLTSANIEGVDSSTIAITDYIH